MGADILSSLWRSSLIIFIFSRKCPVTLVPSYIKSSIKANNSTTPCPNHFVSLQTSRSVDPLIYPANSIRLDGRPRRLWCYEEWALSVGYSVWTQLHQVLQVT